MAYWMMMPGERIHTGVQWVLDTSLDAVCVMDAHGIVVGWNDHAAVCFGWREHEAIGRRLSEIIVPQALRDAHEAGLTHYLATGEGPVLNRRIEVSAVHRDGNEFPVELSITAIELGERLFIGFVRDITDRRVVTERQQRQLQESDHRVKNMLTVVSAIAHQTARASSNVEAFQQSFNSRLEALAQSHSLLANKSWDEVALTALAEQVLSAEVALGRARFGGPEILLSPARVLGLSMILHELYTNAVKYGALCTDDGGVALDWERKGEEVELIWSECGPPCTHESSTSGFGQRMIAMAVQSDLNGTIERDWRPEGLTATIRFPID